MTKEGESLKFCRQEIQVRKTQILSNKLLCNKDVYLRSSFLDLSPIPAWGGGVNWESP